MIYLISGFMGAGKTTLLNELKKEQGLNQFEFLDLDFEIKCTTDFKTLGELIREIGFPEFRIREEKRLFALLETGKKRIISLGGGTLTERVVEFISKLPFVKITYLDTPFSKCLERIEADQNRPLSSLPKEELRELYLKRRALVKGAFFFKEQSELLSYILEE